MICSRSTAKSLFHTLFILNIWFKRLLSVFCMPLCEPMHFIKKAFLSRIKKKEQNNKTEQTKQH